MSNFNTNLQSNNTDLQAILDAVNALPDSGSGEQATPVISVNASTGLITATAGTKSSTKQLAFQPAKTITPTTTSQIAVSSGYYTGGNITVAAIPSTYVKPSGTKTITENGTYDVKSYASATVNVKGGDVDHSVEDSFITRTFSSYTNDRVTSIGDYAFYYCSRLISVNFQNCTSIGSEAFNGCKSLTSVSFPVCSYIGGNAFQYCPSLTRAAFGFDIPSTSTTIKVYIHETAFASCTKLTQLILYYPSVATLSNINAFASTPMSISTLTGSFGSIYVPASLVNAYKSATNWATYAD